MSDITFALAGAAGQGIETAEKIIRNACHASGLNCFVAIEVMSRVRGGCNSTSIRISSRPVRAIPYQVDILIPFDSGAVAHMGKRVEESLVIGENENFLGKEGIDIRLGDTAKEHGVPKNIVASGIILGICGASWPEVKGAVTIQFEKKGKDILKGNLAACEKGYLFGADFSKSLDLRFQKKKINGRIMTGSEAVALGAISGGCNFISAYPMSPSTGVLIQLAKHSKEFGIAVEQAEDEIAGINMALGAWYAGARALANTSGGGFALMEEGVSLAGMLEMPCVIHIAQRPGPATGLPTRTGQEDLNLALYSGHGEFPRIIYAPGDLEEAFMLTKKAFDESDRLQIPVFILTDQHLLDSSYAVRLVNKGYPKKRIVKSEADYQRYKLTKTGISPRAVPGYGDGLVCVDSDEHDEPGRITESHAVRNSMVEKRLLKSAAIDDVSPSFAGEKNYKTIVLCWGSTKEIVREAMEIAGKDIAALHFSQVWPVPDISGYIKGKKIVVIENNATGQFAKLIKQEYGIDARLILKYDGSPFFPDELADRLRRL